MSKKILLKTLLPISAVALIGGGIASSLFLTSCSNKKNDPSHYVGNIYGTDWKGYKSGQIQCIPEDGGYTLDLSNPEIAYSATNWVIPYKVKNSKGQVFDVKKIKGLSSPDDHRDSLDLTGSLTIPNSVTSIGEYAFMNCSELTGSLTIPNSVTSIGDDAFEGCSGLTGSLTIGDSVIGIGRSAFGDCSRLTGSLTIPVSVTSIGWAAFYGCSGLTGSLTIGDSVISIDDSAFGECGISSINLRGFDEPPSWGSPNNIFYGWVDHGTVVSDGTYTSLMALDYLITLGLPNTWTPV